MPAPRILLVAPPWRVPHLGSLALATLHPILEAHGLAADELHGAALFPTDGTDTDVDECYSRYLFSPALRGLEHDVDGFVDDALRAILRDANMGGVLYPAASVTWAHLGVDEETLRRRFGRDVRRALVCLDRICERALSVPYDIVGFSLLFDDQVPAALALARRIKAARPDTRIIFGGAACFEEQADGLLASFPDIDAVCHTEGEDVIVPLIQALRGGASLAEVAGVAWRDGDGRIRHNPSPPLLRDLDRLPIPEYAPFIEQLRATPWAALGVRLLFETSRGCWWGQKSLCTFCGLNAEGLAFRAKSPERAYQEIKRLHETYPDVAYLQATDNILDMKYLSTVFPRLAPLAADRERPLRMFYEVKSNMKPEQVEAMAAAGVTIVQPGIESFSDGVLRLMRKGNTALGQIQFLKWTQQSGIDSTYNVIMCNPGERAEWYQEMIELLPTIRHLPVPGGITPMLLERFSPYFLNPAEFGITDVRPKASYEVLYPPGVDLGRVAYLFDFDHPLLHDEELLSSIRELTAGLKRWINGWREGLAFFVDQGDQLVLVDSRDGAEVRTSLTGPAVQLYLYLDQARTGKAIREAFPTLSTEVIECLLLTWVHRRWIVRSGDRYLAVLPRRGPPLTALRAGSARTTTRERLGLAMAVT